MSLKSLTGKIDNIITLVVLAVCLCMWVAFGFPHPGELATVAGLVLLVLGGLWWLDHHHKI